MKSNCVERKVIIPTKVKMEVGLRRLCGRLGHTRQYSGQGLIAALKRQ